MKPKFFTLLAAATCSLVGCLSAEAVRITEENAPFVYETKAEIPTPREKLAGLISADYLNATDEFTARDLFQKIEPVIDKRIETAKSTKLWRMDISKQLPQYDFDAKAFPTQFNENTFISFPNASQPYAVMFANHELFRHVPVEIEAAKNLSAALRLSRSSTFIVEGVVKDAQERTLNGRKWKAILFEITKVTIKLGDGTLVGVRSGQEVSPPSASPSE